MHSKRTNRFSKILPEPDFHSIHQLYLRTDASRNKFLHGEKDRIKKKVQNSRRPVILSTCHERPRVVVPSGLIPSPYRQATLDIPNDGKGFLRFSSPVWYFPAEDGNWRKMVLIGSNRPAECAGRLATARGRSKLVMRPAPVQELIHYISLRAKWVPCRRPKWKLPQETGLLQLS